jgi:CheY-like chemotaxis protein
MAKLLSQRRTRQLPDLIATDRNMPVLDCEGLCKRLRLYPNVSKISIVVMSAIDASTADKRLWSVFLRKPVDAQQPIEAISSLVKARPDPASVRYAHAGMGSLRWQGINSKCWP